MCDCSKCENYKEKKKSAFKKAFVDIMRNRFSYREETCPDPSDKDVFIWNAAIDAVMKLRSEELTFMEIVSLKEP